MKENIKIKNLAMLHSSVALKFLSNESLRELILKVSLNGLCRIM
jgi:hypothetical protein